MPSASSSRGREGEKILVGVEVLDQRREHLVRHIGDELHVVTLEGGLHDVVPRIGIVHQERSADCV